MMNKKLPKDGVATPPSDRHNITVQRLNPEFIPPRLDDKEVISGAVHTTLAGFPNIDPKVVRYYSKKLASVGWKLAAYVWSEGTKGIIRMPVGTEPSPSLLVEKYGLFRGRLEAELLGSQNGGHI
ncbi:MAG: hypothetical protein Q9O24_07760 [Gammaproteobacteria bacterium]|nr:hypothetical protein [Gammaproteobacteria bacterium]